MRRALFIVPAILIAVLALGAVGAFAYDSSNEGHIAAGVSIGGVNVGGMTGDEARQRLADEVTAPLEQPVKIKVADKKYKLSAEDADVQVDSDELVDKALDASRQGSFITRAWRDLTGSGLGLSMPVESSYSKDAVAKLVGQISDDVDQAPKDASVDPGPDGLSTAPGADGREVAADKLQKDIKAALSSPDGSRDLKGKVATVAPTVTEDQLSDKYPLYITVDRSTFKLRLYRDLKLEKTYDVAVGAQGYDTPVGLYNIQDKQVDPAWHVPNSDWAGDLAGTVVPGGASDNPLKARWMGIYNGAGIHGTAEGDSIGSAASHGCIRMQIPDVIDLYDRVDVGTPVYIGDS
ncbi:MAG: L,D-transpeptidase ErfK/SrfK [Thermoleophilaceae bacterium]|nr:L,D-transpeptidase ErfK/SrfK [Thermoleophilaceae bacterium]